MNDLRLLNAALGLRSRAAFLKRPSHGKLKLANSCLQTQVDVCERHENSRQTRFYLTPTVCKCVCRLFLCRSHKPTWVCQHEFANLRWLETVSSTFQDVDFDGSLLPLFINWCYNPGSKKLPNHWWTHWYYFCDTIGYHSNNITY